MAITYTWEILKIDVYPQAEGQTNVAFNAHWSCVGTDGEYKGVAIGDQSLGQYQAGTPFTPYEQLTKEQVIAWVKEEMEAEAAKEETTSRSHHRHTKTPAEIEAIIASQIDRQKNPPVVAPSLPW